MRSNCSSLARRALPLFAMPLLALPLAASAHVGSDAGSHHGFIAGLLHPLTGVDHLAVMLAVGLWAALSARRAWPDLLAAPLGFAGMLLFGAVLGLNGFSLPYVEPMIAVSLLALGLLVATRWAVNGLAAAALVGFFALFHGVAHGQEFGASAQAWATLAGMVTATLLLHLGGVLLGWKLRQAPRWMPRLAGSALLLLGAGLLSQQVGA